MKTIPTLPEIYQIKVTLLGTRPPIWRRLLVPSELTLEQLHAVLQAAMGWEDCHLHEFRIGSQRFGKPDPSERWLGRSVTLSERTARLTAVMGRVGAKAVYTYDFGDGWQHQLVVEKVLVPEPGPPYPVCIDGQRQGPPEDCGGIGGFYRLLQALRDPEDKEHEELSEWLGRDFDPDAFSLQAVNRRLAHLQRRRSKTAAARRTNPATQ
jgi:hypothetical protein